LEGVPGVCGSVAGDGCCVLTSCVWAGLAHAVVWVTDSAWDQEAGGGNSKRVGAQACDDRGAGTGEGITAKVAKECSDPLGLSGHYFGQCDVFWQLLHSLPLVDAKRMHQGALVCMERTCLSFRNELERASESVEKLGLDLPECVSYHSLNLIALAVQQRRRIQGLFGQLSSPECMWVKEVVEPGWSNCLKDDISFWKLLLTHRQLLYLLEAMMTELCDLTSFVWVGLVDASLLG